MTFRDTVRAAGTDGSSRSTMRVDAWTDGACKGNPGPGGWGALLVWGERERELWGGDTLTTNNKMELTAVIQALRVLSRPCAVVLHVDSTYVMNGMTSWIDGWKRNGWRTKSRQPVKNLELWQELDRQIAQHEVTWEWVKGHAGDAGNERADQLANRGVDDVLQGGEPGVTPGQGRF